MNCKDCKYKDKGDCKRYPPQVVVYVENNDFITVAEYPSVSDDDYCGEFKGVESEI